MAEWKLVPVEPTPEMERAADDYAMSTAHKPKGMWWWGRLYEAMLSAAPAAPTALKPVQPRALALSIAELDAWEARADGEAMTPAESESVMLVLHELKRLRAAAPTGPSDWPLPCDVTIEGVTFNKGGCTLQSIIDTMGRIVRSRAASGQAEAPVAPQAEARQPMTEALRHAGAMLANCAFNLAQRNPGQFTTRDIEVLDESRKRWDDALRAALESAPTAPPAQAGTEGKS